MKPHTASGRSPAPAPGAFAAPEDGHGVSEAALPRTPSCLRPPSGAGSLRDSDPKALRKLGRSGRPALALLRLPGGERPGGMGACHPASYPTCVLPNLCPT